MMRGGSINSNKSKTNSSRKTSRPSKRPDNTGINRRNFGKARKKRLTNKEKIRPLVQ